MAKKVKFPLEMENGVQVRNIEELRENFSLLKVLGYLKEEKLIIWLQDRYENDIAEAVENLDVQDEALAKKICEIFDVPYDATIEKELEKAVEREERIGKLREYTDDEQYVEVIDNVAFNQEELYALLDEDVDKIYLCGERFSIPSAKAGVTYIGVNNPTVEPDSEEDWDENGITLKQVNYDNKIEKMKLLNGRRIKITQCLIQKIRSMSNIEIRNMLEESYPYTIPEMNSLYRMTEEYDKENFIGELGVLDFLPSDIDAKTMEIEGKNIYRIARFVEFFHAEYVDKRTMVYHLPVDEDIETRNYNLAMAVYVVYKIIAAIPTKDVFSCKDAVEMLDIIVNKTLEKNKEDVIRRIQNIETLVDSVNSHLTYIVQQKQLTGFRLFSHNFEQLMGKLTDSDDIKKKELFSWAKKLSKNNGEDIRCLDLGEKVLYTNKKIVVDGCDNSTVDCSQRAEKAEACKVRLLDNGALVVWKGDYAKRRQIASYCNAYIQKETDIYYLLPGGTFEKYNFLTDEKKIFDISLAEYSPDSHSFIIVDNMVYYKARANTWDKDYYQKLKRLFVLNLQDDSIQIVPYKFFDGIGNIINYCNIIFVQEGPVEMNTIYRPAEMNIIYRNENGEWEQMLEKVNAYCFNDNYIYFVREEKKVITGIVEYRMHMFYRINIDTKEEYKIAEVKYDLLNGGYVKKIEIRNNRIIYQEDSSSGIKTKEIQI